MTGPVMPVNCQMFWNEPCIHRTTTIYKGDLPFHLNYNAQAQGKNKKPTLKDAQSQAQIKAIYQALARTNYNKAKASKLLGIHRTLLYKKMKEYNIGLKPE